MLSILSCFYLRFCVCHSLYRRLLVSSWINFRKGIFVTEEDLVINKTFSKCSLSKLFVEKSSLHDCAQSLKFYFSFNIILMEIFLFPSEWHLARITLMLVGQINCFLSQCISRCKNEMRLPTEYVSTKYEHSFILSHLSDNREERGKLTFIDELQLAIQIKKTKIVEFQ